MAKITANARYSPTDIFVIVAYLVILLVIAILIWKFVSPILSLIIAGIFAYVIDLRKLIGRKN